MRPDKYYQKVLKQIDEVYDIAEKAREKGLDANTIVEIPQSIDIASRVEGLVGPKNIAKRIRELLKDMEREEMTFQILREIVEGKFGEFESREKMAEQCVRTGLAIMTEAVPAGSTEGIAGAKIRKNPDDSEYLCIMVAGPIRSAGGTASGQTAMLTDYTAKLMGLSTYRPTETEIERYVEEVNIYHNSVSRLQYKPSDDDVRAIIKNCPICIDGDPTTQIEVSIYKNLDRVDTNQIRGGACLVIGEGIAQKAAKLLKFSNKHKLGWGWLESIVKIGKKSSTGDDRLKPVDTYLADIVGGRPIFAYPPRPGAFRLRYGKARNNGIMAKCIHPAAMEVLDEFPAIGTQLKVEKPGKGTAIAPCDTIEPPIVKLKNGDVIIVDSVHKAKDIKDDVDQILFLGDMLITYGDFKKTNHPLLPSGNCEEWWEQIVQEKNLPVNHKMDIREAINFSKGNDIPLHPKYTYMYEHLDKDELVNLVNYVKGMEREKIIGLEGKEVLRLKNANDDNKKLLEKICIPHKLRDNTIIIDNPEALIETVNGEKSADIEKIKDDYKDTISLVKIISNVKILPKYPTFIGARMGRPEKAKERRMSPPPHGLFPISNYGGKTRDLTKAMDRGKISLEMLNNHCPKCMKPILGYKCKDCNERGVLAKICPQCGVIVDDYCDKCNRKGISYAIKILDLREEMNKVSRKLEESIPDKYKGVIGTVNNDKYYEAIEKGFLRAKHEIFVFKDGTCRFDCTDMPLTHFKAKEARVSLEKLKEIGYSEDYLGKPLKNEEQILELVPQDIIVPLYAGEYMLRISKFIDDLLEKFYGLPRYYNCKTKEDLVGHLVIGLAPHISVGVMGRIVGFTRGRVCYAHPYWHTAKRRNSDGDEDSIMLLLDGLMNFSKKYLPSSRGGTMDAPMVLTTKLNPMEVDDEVFEMENVDKYPIEFYEATQKIVNPSDIKIPTVKEKLGKEDQYNDFKFTHNTDSVDEGPIQSRYTQLKTMAEKVEKQLELAKRIECVDERDVAERVLNYHFLRDIYGNLRAFGQQSFRCVECNSKYRRPPLIGKCSRCGGKLLLTVNKGGIKKYLNVSQEIAEEYGLGDYVKQRLIFVQRDLDTIFPKEKTTQQTLANFV